jgi:hypothetical protein
MNSNRDSQLWPNPNPTFALAFYLSDWAKTLPIKHKAAASELEPAEDKKAAG